MKLTSILCSKDWAPLNKNLLRHMDANAALLLAWLCDEYEGHIKNDTLTEDGTFFCTKERVEEHLFFKRRVQDSAFDALTKLGILTTKKAGQSNKRHVVFFEDAAQIIAELVKAVCTKCTKRYVQNVQSGMDKTYKAVGTECTERYVQNSPTHIPISDNPNPNTNNSAPKGADEPAPKKKPKEDYSEFAAYCQEHGFEHVPKIARLLTKEKVAAKRKEMSELAFYETVAAIEGYLKTRAPNMPYSDLSKVWRQYAFTNGCAYTKKAHNLLYSSVYGKAKESYTKSDIEALGAIWCVLEANTKTSDGTKASYEQICKSVDTFFEQFPTDRKNDKDLKLSFIHSDIETIIGEIRGEARRRTSAQPKGGTVVTKELLSNVAEMYRKEDAEKAAQEQAMRAAGLIL